jgi:2'-5' RNA ligase
MEFETEAFIVTEIVLIKSDLGPHGSRYTPLSHYRLS